jgi:hypothetical protein
LRGPPPTPGRFWEAGDPAYVEVRDGLIGWMRLLCAGKRPIAAAE